jgi:hypothetical protein
MKRTRWTAVVVTVLSALIAVSVAPAVAEPMQWGDPADGVRLGVAIEPAGQSEFHAGEMVRLSVKLKPDWKMLLPADINNNLDYYCVVHVVTPDGHESVWDPAFGSAAQGDAHHAQQWSKFAETISASPRLRLARDRKPWFDAAKDQPELSLRAVGKYRLWLEFRVSADAETPRHAWHSTAKSGVVEWHVSDLPADKRQLTMTDEQKRLVNRWLSGKHTVDVDYEKRMNDSPVKQILLAKNEGLADKFLQVMIEEKSVQHALDAWYMLSIRAGSTDDGDLGIDGPYSKKLAQWELDLVEGKLRWPSAAPKATYKDALWSVQGLRGGSLIEQVLVYLTFHPEDRKIHDRVVKQCTLGGNLSGNAISFKVLTKFGVLKKGTTLAEAVAVLGTPSRQMDDFAEWYWPIDTRNAFRPARWEVYCKLKDGSVASHFELHYRDL